MLGIFSSDHFQQVIQQYGLWGLLIVILLESMGLPLPGEATLIGMAVYAGTTHHVSLTSVIATASIAAIMGDNAGYFIGKIIGTRLLRHYGRYIHINETRLQIGEYLFHRHGGKIIFFGRFITLLRTLAAFLAGANHMPWRTFFLMNTLGAITWAVLFGSGSYFFGDRLFSLNTELRILIIACTLIGIILSFLFLRRHEQALARKARAVLYGGSYKQD
ncbi:DedA family protein [Martelella alba]|uniref:DedA family protein n=1 Tax=Martelella alba TaxID=2590451 RepID=A0ABY2SRL7_9HYPH|nr:DedA family protein [Martelella alba]TKI08864.1 DedA family protein [Martelella alba]